MNSFLPRSVTVRARDPLRNQPAPEPPEATAREWGAFDYESNGRSSTPREGDFPTADGPPKADPYSSF
jgi:hypothetical protein